MNSDFCNANKFVNIYNVIVELLKQPIAPPPLYPELNQHWLVVDGSQPAVDENPKVIPSQLTKAVTLQPESDVLNLQPAVPVVLSPEFQVT